MYAAVSFSSVFPPAPPRPATPEKFTIPHRCARFGPGGHLVQVLPNLPSAGQPALVDIHSLEVNFKHGAFQHSLPGLSYSFLRMLAHDFKLNCSTLTQS